MQPIWVDDVAAYFAAGVEPAEAANRTFELGGPDVVTWNELWARLKSALGTRRPSMHVPFALMRPQATVLEQLPNPPVTRDQLTMLAAGDNVVSNADAVDTFGLPARPPRRAAAPRRCRPADRAGRARERSDPQGLRAGSAPAIPAAGKRRGAALAAPRSSVPAWIGRGASGRSGESAASRRAYASPQRWLGDSPCRSRGHAPTGWHLHCPYWKSPLPDHLLSADSRNVAGGLDVDLDPAVLDPDREGVDGS